MNWTRTECLAVSATVGVLLICSLALVMGYATRIGVVVW